jgi:hypothetical protein
MVVFLALLVVAVALWVRARRGGDVVTLGRHGEVVLVWSCDGFEVEWYRGRPDTGRAWSWLRGRALHDPAAVGSQTPLRHVGARSRGWRGFGVGEAKLVCEVTGRSVEHRWVCMPHWYAVGVVLLVGMMLTTVAVRGRR